MDSPMDSLEEETKCSNEHLKPPEMDTGSSITGITIPTSATAPTAPPLLSSVANISVSRPPFLRSSSLSDSEAYDRVFPIRSVVNVEPQPSGPESPGARSTTSMSGSSPSTMNLINGLVGTPAQEGSESSFRMGSQSISESVSYFTAEAPGSHGASSAGLGSEGGFYTERHKHVITEDGHMVVTGVAGAEKMQRCEDEAIHIPGAVQGFGCLVALRELEDGQMLNVRVVSEV